MMSSRIMSKKSKNFFRINCFLRSDDAVSETLDFVVIIGILILAFGIIAVAGHPILKKVQEAKYIENTKQSFILMADNINKVAVGKAPSRSVEMKIYGGRLSVTGSGEINITATVYNSTKVPPGPEEVPIIDHKLQGIENSIGDVVIAYEGTAVWAKYPDGTVNLYRPPIIYRNKVLIFPVMNIVGKSSIAGEGMSRIEVEGDPVITPYNNLSYINVTIMGDYVEGWKRYFEDELKWECVGQTSVSCRLNETNLNVYIVKIDLNAEIE